MDYGTHHKSSNYIYHLYLGEDDKIKEFLDQLGQQLDLKHVTKLERGQPLVFLGRQIEYYGDHIALSMTK
eukprot:174961-Amphidinium_carterae.1